jgi:hypothetical protein
MPELSGSELPFDRVQMTRRRRSRSQRLAKENRGPHAGTSKHHGWRRTAEDEQVLDFAGRFGALTLRHAADHFYNGVFATGKERAQFMSEAGLLERNDNLRWAGTLVYPTAWGLAAVKAPGRPELRALVPGEERMLHRLLVAEAALRLQGKGITVASERQMRAVERAEDKGEASRHFAASSGVHLFAEDNPGQPVVRPSLDGVDRPRFWGIPVGTDEKLHWPDFVAVVGGRMIAVEVELELKERWRMNATLRAYKRSIEAGHIAQVLWHVTPDVQMQLEGRRGPDGWEDGLLQEIGYLDSGVAPDWKVKGRPMVVRPVEASDEGVVYALSQRILIPSMRSSYRQWKQWRKVYDGTETPLGFEDWLMRPGTIQKLKTMG